MNLEPLLYWCRERENIRLKKEAGEPWPWTSDPILQKFSFCNLRREDDRITRWIDQHIRKPFAHSPYLWWMLAASRQINWDPTLAELIAKRAWPTEPDFTTNQVTIVLEARSARGEKWQTGAYMIRAENNQNVPWVKWSKARYIAEIVLGSLWADRPRFVAIFAAQPTMAEVHSMLSEYRGWGPFLSYQVCVDMRFTRLLENAPDREMWAVAGPGTVRGLNRLLGRPIKARLSQEEALEHMLQIYPVLKAEFPAIDLSDVPNSACEVDKYLRVKCGEGRPRARYLNYLLSSPSEVR